jgi:CxxC motif-containing protein (DUF1111 family)
MVCNSGPGGKTEQVCRQVATATAGVELDEHLLDLVAVEADYFAVPSVRDANAVMTADGRNADQAWPETIVLCHGGSFSLLRNASTRHNYAAASEGTPFVDAGVTDRSYDR